MYMEVNPENWNDYFLSSKLAQLSTTLNIFGRSAYISIIKDSSSVYILPTPLTEVFFGIYFGGEAQNNLQRIFFIFYFLFSGAMGT